MEVKSIRLLLLNIFVAVNIQTSIQYPNEMDEEKAAYKSGFMPDIHKPVSVDTIKQKMKESGVFDWNDKSLTASEKKELNKLFEAVKIMMTSRARQPYNVQNMFSSLRIVERAVKKQLKEGQISDTLADKFKWDNINSSPPLEIVSEPTTKSSEKLKPNIKKPKMKKNKQPILKNRLPLLKNKLPHLKKSTTNFQMVS